MVGVRVGGSTPAFFRGNTFLASPETSGRQMPGSKMRKQKEGLSKSVTSPYQTAGANDQQTEQYFLSQTELSKMS